MADQFLKFTVNKNNAQQQEGLKAIIAKGSNISGGSMFESGTDLSIFEGDVNQFNKSFTEITEFSAEQSSKIFGALDADGNGKIDTNEINAFAALGDGFIENDEIRLDETDITALMAIARENVEVALEEDPEEETTVNTDKTETQTEEKPANTEKQTTTSAQRATISDNDAAAKAQELRSAMAILGTDAAKVTQILEESGYSSADIVKIMDTFETNYGETLMNDIQCDYSGSAETTHREVLYNAAAEEARQTLGWNDTEDIPEDVAKKANEFYSQLESSGATGYMADFNKLSDEEKAQILVACDMLHSDESAVSRVTEKTYSFLGIGRFEDKYVDGMITALKTVANTAPEVQEEVQAQVEAKTEEKPATTQAVADEAVTTEEQKSTTSEKVITSTGWDMKTDKGTLQYQQGKYYLDGKSCNYDEKTGEITFDETVEADALAETETTNGTEATAQKGVLTEEAYKELSSFVDDCISGGYVNADTMSKLMDKIEDGGYNIKDFMAKYDSSHSTSFMDSFGTADLVYGDDKGQEVAARFTDSVIEAYGGVDNKEFQQWIDGQCVNKYDDGEGYTSYSYNDSANFLAQQIYQTASDKILSQESDTTGTSTLQGYYNNHVANGSNQTPQSGQTYAMGLEGMAQAKTDYDQRIADRDEYLALYEKYGDQLGDDKVQYESYGMGGGHIFSTNFTGNNKMSDINGKIKKEGIGNGTGDENDYYDGMIQASLQKLREYDALMGS